MSDRKDGGPAFPQISELGGIASTNNGMTLRDYFAAKAMAARISDGALSRGWLHEEIAADAYKMADATLSEREGARNE